MRCPNCLHDSRVTETRPRNDNTVSRTRQCTVCGLKFRTTESSDTPTLPISGDRLRQAVDMLQETILTLTQPGAPSNPPNDHTP